MILQFSGCDQFGSIPKDDDYLRMKKSSNYNIPEDKFVNQNSDVMENVKKIVDFGQILEKIWLTIISLIPTRQNQKHCYQKIKLH